MHHLAENEHALAGPAVYRNLPLPPTPLVGRVQEVEAVAALLRRRDVRLLTLIGPPGIGKTRLALQVAAHLLADPAGRAAPGFPDGVCFVPLAPISDPDLVLSAITQALELHGAANEALPARLRSALHGKQLLLLLDNFEQVVTAAPLLADLLAACPGVKMLITSRELLALYGEHHYPVPPLALPRPDEPLNHEALAAYEAVALFLQRAQAVSPGFQLSEHDASVVAEICRRLDGLPLAIELTAARILVLPPAELLARLTSRLKLLTSGARNLPERQRTLRGTIEWSYNLLDPTEQILFRRLGVFVGGSTLDAIEHVCGPDLTIETLDGVTSLIGKSLMRLREGPPRQQAPSVEPRYGMLETIREYARDKLQESGEADVLRRRHAAYFLRLAEAAEPHLWDSQQVAWLHRLLVEYDNLRAALEWARETREVETAVRLGRALLRFWFNYDYVGEGRQHMEEVMRFPGPWTPAVQALAYHTLGTLAAMQDDNRRAGALLEQSARFYREVGDTWYLAESLNFLALVTEEWDKAEALFNESLALRQELGDQVRISQSLMNLSALAAARYDYERAEALNREALALKRAQGEKRGMIIVLQALGAFAQWRGDPQQAEAFFAEALALCVELEQKRSIVLALEGLMRAAAARGLDERAARLAGAVDGTRARFQMPPGERAGTQMGEPTPPDMDDRCLEEAQARLGEAAWTTAVAAGRAMTLEDATAYALRIPAPPSGGVEPQPQLPAPPGARYPDTLTEREVEVLRLIAAGKSNQEIARDLVLSLRTVERHISNIYQKIGATGKVARATATAYALRHSLTT